MHSNLSKESIRIQKWLLTLLCSALAGCVGVPAGQEAAVVTRAQMQMGTLVKITAVARSESVAQAAATAGFAEIRRLEELLSTWIPTSELSHVNTSAGVMPVHVSPETLTVIQRAIQAAKMTDGGFNIAIGPAVDAWRVTEDQRIPTESELEALRPLVNLQAVHVDTRDQTIYLGKAGMRIDVGGIGKGYAADQAVEALRRAGAIAGVVALSGDIKTFGRLPGGKLFPVGIQHPRKDGWCWPGLICRTKRFLPPGIMNASSSWGGSDIIIFSIRVRSTQRVAARRSRWLPVKASGQMGWTQEYLLWESNWECGLSKPCRTWRPSSWIMKGMSMCPQGCGIGSASREAGGLRDDQPVERWRRDRTNCHE